MFNNLLHQRTWQYDIHIQNFLNNQFSQAQGCLYTLPETHTEKEKLNISMNWLPNAIMLGNELNQKWTIHKHNLVRHLFTVKMISEQMAWIKPVDLLISAQILGIGDAVITERSWDQYAAFLNPDPWSSPLGYNTFWIARLHLLFQKRPSSIVTKCDDNLRGDWQILWHHCYLAP